MCDLSVSVSHGRLLLMPFGPLIDSPVLLSSSIHFKYLIISNTRNYFNFNRFCIIKSIFILEIQLFTSLFM